MTKTYSLKNIFSLFWRKKIWLIIGAVLGAVIAFCVSEFYLPLKYASHITMYVQSYTTMKDNENEINDINNSKKLINTYIEVLKDDAVLEALSDKIIENNGMEKAGKAFKVNEGKISTGQLRNSLKITAVTDTSAVNVVATTKDPEISASICNCLAQIAPEYIDRAVGVGSINTIDTAKVNKNPVSPNKKKNSVIGFAAGLMLVAMMILLIDFFDNSVKDAEQLSEEYKKPILGKVHAFGGSKKNSEVSRMTLLEENVPFGIVESYKSIRTNIMFALSTSNKKAIAVTSPNPSEGKSTSAVNIAIAFAQTENKVLLIDADMRKPVVHKTFELTNTEGLSSVLGKMNTAEEAIKKDVAEGLDVLCAGPIPPNPSELLASEQFTALIDSLSEKYDFIVLDTPPVNMVSDVMTVKDSVAGALFVVKYGTTSFDDISECMKKAELADMDILGFILNEIKVRGNGSYYSSKYKYDYGYSYGDKPELKTESKSSSRSGSKKEKKK
ncbi:MAG: polysaccharide biosynthesis tyrosine autokinase [Ruminococcus sp.]|nr:polysaccharide biosynthesis tyrosine autokinase [Ruminococcus sp.]